MAIQLNDNIYVRAGKPYDYKYGPYLSINEANQNIPLEERYHGLMFGVYSNPSDLLNSDILVYYYYNGLTDSDVKLFVNYVHPSYNVFDLTLSGSTVIDKIETDSIGSVVNITTRNLTTEDIQTSTLNFNNILSGLDNTIQKALDTLDNHSHSLQEISDTGNVTTNRLVLGDLSVDTNTLSTVNGNVLIGTLTDDGNKLQINGNLTIKNSIFINDENLDVDSVSTEIISEIDANKYTGCFFDFIIRKNSNLRGGTVYVIHDGTNVEFTEVSTNDLGDTSDVSFSVDLDNNKIRLLATVTSDDWIIKSLARGI